MTIDNIPQQLQVPMMIYDEDIKQIIYERINDEYGYGLYGDFRVIVRKDGHINATKLCTSGGKRYDHWIDNSSSKELIKELEIELCSPLNKGEQVCHFVHGGSNYDIKGTYVHPLLIPHIASWISPKFAIMVSRIVNSFVVKDFRYKMREKDDKIDELIKKIDNQTAKLDHQTKIMEHQSEEINELHNEVLLVSDKLDTANENIIETLVSFGEVSNQSVPLDRCPAAAREQLVILCLEQGRYHCIRAQARIVPRSIEVKRRMYPNARIVHTFECRPNSRELWIAVRTRLGFEPDIMVKGNTIGIEDLANEAKIIQIIEECNQEKMDKYQDSKRRALVDDDYPSYLNNAEETGDEKTERGEPDRQTHEERILGVETNQPQISARDFLTMRLPELKQFCRERGWSKYSRLNKKDLVNFIIKGLLSLQNNAID